MADEAKGIEKFQIKINQKKGENLCYQGEEFTRNRSNYWRCTKWNKGCKAALTTTQKKNDHYLGYVSNSIHSKHEIQAKEKVAQSIILAKTTPKSEQDLPIVVAQLKQKKQSIPLLTGEFEDNVVEEVHLQEEDEEGGGVQEENRIEEREQPVDVTTFVIPQIGLDKPLDMAELLQNFLRRSQIVDLLQQPDSAKSVTGSFVRLFYYVSGEEENKSDEKKQNKYKVVQILGIVNSEKPYKIGSLTIKDELKLEWEQTVVYSKVTSLSDALPTNEEFDEWIRNRNEHIQSKVTNPNKIIPKRRLALTDLLNPKRYRARKMKETIHASDLIASSSKVTSHIPFDENASMIMSKLQFNRAARE